MIRLAIVEDDELYCRELQEYLHRFEEENREKFQIKVFRDGDEIAGNYRAEYDIILMDIEMCFVDGMTAAEEIRHSDKAVEIIFITNSPQYAIQGYKVGAMDYILKPVSYYAFSESLRSALERRKRRGNKEFIILTVPGGRRRLDVSRILYVEVMDHDLIYHTLDGEITLRGSMRETEKELAAYDFFQCNKGFLVNLEHVEAIRKNEVLVGKELIPVSRARKKAFMDALNLYLSIHS